MSKRAPLVLLGLVLLVSLVFSGPVMQKLVGSVGGTMDQHPYSALSVVDANHAIQGVTWRKQVHFSNLPLRVQIDNRLGENHNYHWVAMQGWRVLSSGTVFLESNSSREIGIPVVAASAGMVTVALDGGSIYVRVPISIPGRAQDVKIQP